MFLFLTRWKPFHRSAYLKSETDRRKAQPEDKKFFEALIKPKVHIPTICFLEYGVFCESSRMIVLPIHCKVHLSSLGERSGLVVESHSGARGRVFDTYLRLVVSLSKDTLTPRKVLVIPRKLWLCPDMTEKLLTELLSINTNKQTCHL